MQGKLFSLDGCSHEARGAAAPLPGFTTTQGRLGPNHLPSERRQGRLGIPLEGCTGSPPDAGQGNHPTTDKNASAAPCGAGLEAWRGSSIAMPCGLSVNRPSRRDGQGPPASRTARIRTTCRSKRQRVRQRAAHTAGRWPGRCGAAGLAVSRGAKPCAAGIARRAFPWRQAKRAAPQARRREGLKPKAVTTKTARGAARKPGGACADTPSVFSRTAQTENVYALLACHLANQCAAERCEILIR